MNGDTLSPYSCNACWRRLVVSIVPKRLGHNFFLSFSEEEHTVSETMCYYTQILQKYRGADKSLARPGRKQATATEDFDVHTECPRRNVPDFTRMFLMLNPI
jgi:hypothetical protein